MRSISALVAVAGTAVLAAAAPGHAAVTLPQPSVTVDLSTGHQSLHATVDEAAVRHVADRAGSRAVTVVRDGVRVTARCVRVDHERPAAPVVTVRPARTGEALVARSWQPGTASVLAGPTQPMTFSVTAGPASVSGRSGRVDVAVLGRNASVLVHSVMHVGARAGSCDVDLRVLPGLTAAG